MVFVGLQASSPGTSVQTPGGSSACCLSVSQHNQGRIASMTKSYLVTGGAGFLGSALVRRLVDGGNRVRVFDNQSRGRIDRLAGVASSIEYVSGDVRNPAEVERAVKGIDSVCHLAFINGTKFFYTMPELVLEVGVKGIVNVLDACLHH